MPRTLLALIVATLVAVASHAGQSGAGLQFEVTLDPSLPAQQPGRLLVVMASSDRREPRHLIGRTGQNAVATIGVDTSELAPGDTAVLDGAAHRRRWLR